MTLCPYAFWMQHSFKLFEPEVKVGFQIKRFRTVTRASGVSCSLRQKVNRLKSRLKCKKCYCTSSQKYIYRLYGIGKVRDRLIGEAFLHFSDVQLLQQRQITGDFKLKLVLYSLLIIKKMKLQHIFVSSCKKPFFTHDKLHV